MKIYLFLEQLYEFELSKEVFGSFNFDADSSEESKLINVEAENNEWVLYSTDDVSIMFDGVPHSRVVIRPNNFYTLHRNNLQYLIYVSDIGFCNIMSYSFDQKLNLVIGNSEDCNIKYNCSYMNDKKVLIHYNEENNIILENPDSAFVYVNHNYIGNKTINIKIGDEIVLFGFKLVLLNNLLLVKDRYNLVTINQDAASLFSYSIPLPQTPENVNVMDIDLYKNDDYFSKSPRLRRTIETKNIKFTEAPQVRKGEGTPMILTLGPMFTMGIVSATTLLGTISSIQNGETTMDKAKPRLIMGIAMLVSTILWPFITQLYNRIKAKLEQRRTIRKYKKYLSKKRKEFQEETELQKEILLENLISVDDVLNIIKTRNYNFWDRRLDQIDLLVTRVGIGDQKLDAEVEYPEKEFTLDESKLRDMADELVAEYKYIKDVPIGYSFAENKVTAVMGDYNVTRGFMDNILLQFMTFYSYDDLKIAVFTNEKNKSHWEYLKYLNHNLADDRSIRFFASDTTSVKTLSEYFNAQVSNRINMLSQGVGSKKPYYILLIDDYDMVKRYDFVKMISEIDQNIGFSMIILENKIRKLPSKCSNFITVNAEGESSILINAFEKQEHQSFKSEIKYDVDMMSVVRYLSNIPIELQGGKKGLPEAITFLEMEKVGKVEQLNILNRWEKNDSTQSLKSEIGVDDDGEFIYLDLHEKYHGPHGLIAGTTGSGKSEFIITYILSLSMNYSPDDVAFILIDYKGGGLAYAFENKTTGTVLPHLAGTITNLDKAEMHRTLVSIDSEVKRRQRIFNAARDKMGESTIDIYKYQRLYKEGNLDEPIPHLFIICDEFAELKAQQPDFMDNLISVARIGRSLGVHLILATQKPTGVVNDQIWSNTKFRVCLKVQDESDSKEMLKRPEAAWIKQAGRFYLQVGMDEIFELGQSGWCGAKYYPSDRIVKQVDKSINFINEFGIPFKSIQGSNESVAVEAQGEQLAAIMKNIIEISNRTGKKVKKLWLDNIPKRIVTGDLYQKYSFTHQPNAFQVIIGEYDAPEKQEQGMLVHDFLENGNTVIYGIDGSERENLVNTMIYSTTLQYSSEDINFYLVDYGSESLRRWATIPHMGGMVFNGDNEKYANLLKMIREEIETRKKLFVDYGGEYKNYIKNSGEKLPLKVVIFNGFDNLFENNNDAYEVYPELTRDTERYGIVFVFTSTSILYSKIANNFNTAYTFRMKDSSDYPSIYDARGKISLSGNFGRGLVKQDAVHEFQTSFIVQDDDVLNEYLTEYVKQVKDINSVSAKRIPTLPDIVDYEFIENDIHDITDVPIGVYRKELDISKYNFLANIGTVITSNKVANTVNFIENLMRIFEVINIPVLVFDAVKGLPIKTHDNINYCNDDFDSKLKDIIEKLNKLLESKSTQTGIILINGIDKFLSKLENTNIMKEFTAVLKKYENFSLIIADDSAKIKGCAFEQWYQAVFSNSDGIWIGKGILDQNVFKLSVMDRSMNAELKNNMGYIMSEGYPNLFKLIEFEKEVDDNEE